MRSPFLPEIRAQSSGLVVLGRSSFSLYSWRIDSSRSVGADAPALAGDGPLDGQLLGPADDVLDHGPRGEVPVVEDLLVAVLVGHLEEPVLVVVPVHLGHGLLDHGLDGLGRVARRRGAGPRRRRAAGRRSGSGRRSGRRPPRWAARS